MFEVIKYFGCYFSFRAVLVYIVAVNMFSICCWCDVMSEINCSFSGLFVLLCLVQSRNVVPFHVCSLTETVARNIEGTEIVNKECVQRACRIFEVLLFSYFNSCHLILLIFVSDMSQSNECVW